MLNSIQLTLGTHILKRELQNNNVKYIAGVRNKKLDVVIETTHLITLTPVNSTYKLVNKIIPVNRDIIVKNKVIRNSIRVLIDSFPSLLLTP